MRIKGKNDTTSGVYNDLELMEDIEINIIETRHDIVL